MIVALAQQPLPPCLAEKREAERGRGRDRVRECVTEREVTERQREGEGVITRS
jgi:hypothetical protein